MKFIEIYNRILKLWPEEIDISDGYAVGNGFMFPTLSKYYDNIDDKIDHKKDIWGNFAAYSFFQAFHKAAQQSFENGGKILITKRVSKQLIDKYIIDHLNAAEYENESKEYQDVNGNKIIVIKSTVVQAINNAEKILPGSPAPDGEEDYRWQAIIEVGNFVESNPKEVWDFIAKWGVLKDSDLQSAIATCLLEHLLEYHFNFAFEKVEKLAKKIRSLQPHFLFVLNLVNQKC